jgi:phage gp36-like protein
MLTAAIVTASDRIDSYCRSRYTTPFAALPSELVDTCGILAAYRVLVAGGAVPERLRDRYEDEIKYLEQVASGKVALNTPNGEGDNTQSPASSHTLADRWADKDDMRWM